ncbi:hypothetical protein [Rhizobium sp. RCC_161_2]|uniref:hypothetical protein n=1 Tax=Rhizobium sp. RCC_161_2 TaxID=3239219 RepID=UPI003524F7E5
MADTDAILAEALGTTRQSIAGVTAKWHSPIEMENPGARLKEMPWPELRSILADLLWIDIDTPRV